MIEEDPELRLDTDTTGAMLDGEVVFAAWGEEAATLSYYNGVIEAKNPSEPLVRKMVGIAQRLDAFVQGDDGERYPEALVSRPVPKPGLWRRLLGGG